jgi:hypothetical protein
VQITQVSIEPTAGRGSTKCPECGERFLEIGYVVEIGGLSVLVCSVCGSGLRELVRDTVD